MMMLIMLNDHTALQMTLVQFMDFLHAAILTTSKAQYAALFPSLYELCTRYS